MRFGYNQGFQDGQLQAVQVYERVVALLREELADARRDRDAQLSRADAACDLLLGHLGTRAISLAGKQEEVARADRAERVTRALSSLPDPTEELPFGHPSGTYRTPQEAALWHGDAEDVAGAEG